DPDGLHLERVAGDVLRCVEVVGQGEGAVGRDHARAGGAAVEGRGHHVTGGGVDGSDDVVGRRHRGAGGVGRQVHADLRAVDVDAERLVRPVGRDDQTGVVAALVAPGGAGDVERVGGEGADGHLGVPAVAVGLVRQVDDLGQLGELVRQS